MFERTIWHSTHNRRIVLITAQIWRKNVQIITQILHLRISVQTQFPYVNTIYDSWICNIKSKLFIGWTKTVIWFYITENVLIKHSEWVFYLYNKILGYNFLTYFWSSVKTNIFIHVSIYGSFLYLHVLDWQLNNCGVCH